MTRRVLAVLAAGLVGLSLGLTVSPAVSQLFPPPPEGSPFGQVACPPHRGPLRFGVSVEGEGDAGRTVYTVLDADRDPAQPGVQPFRLEELTHRFTAHNDVEPGPPAPATFAEADGATGRARFENRAGDAATLDAGDRLVVAGRWAFAPGLVVLGPDHRLLGGTPRLDLAVTLDRFSVRADQPLLGATLHLVNPHDHDLAFTGWYRDSVWALRDGRVLRADVDSPPEDLRGEEPEPIPAGAAVEWARVASVWTVRPGPGQYVYHVAFIGPYPACGTALFEVLP